MLKSHGPTRAVVQMMVGLLLFVTACGDGAQSGQDRDDAIASLSTDPSAATTPVDDAVDADLEAPTDAEDAFALFNQCMADHGIEGGISVSVGGDASSGAVQIDEMEPGEIDPQAGSGSIDDFDMEDLDAANKACEGHLANIDAGFDLTPEQQAALDDAQLAFSDCMAEHGVEVPDLGSGSGGIVVSRAVAGEDGDPQEGGLNLDDLDFDFEAFDEATKACDFVFDQLEDLNP